MQWVQINKYTNRCCYCYGYIFCFKLLCRL